MKIIIGGENADHLRNSGPKKQYSSEFLGCWRSQQTKIPMGTAKNKQTNSTPSKSLLSFSQRTREGAV